MAETQKHFGEVFKAKRQELQLSLKEVENTTSIRSSFLKAIEEGQMQQLISPVYAQGFVKQYAAFLGLDGEQMIRDNPQIFAKNTRHEFSYGIGTMEVRATGNSGVKWLPNILWIGLSVLLLGLGWLIAKHLNLV